MVVILDALVFYIGMDSMNHVPRISDLVDLLRSEYVFNRTGQLSRYCDWM